MADLTCRDLVELITDYLDDVLDARTTDLVEQHLALCAGCETYLNQMRRTASLLGEIPVETLTVQMQATLLDAFRDFPR